MSDVWLIFVNKINDFNHKIIKYSASIIKSIISSSKFFSKSSMHKIEIKKLEWELNREKEKLGHYIYKCNSDKIYDFSNNSQFHQYIDKIKEIENFLHQLKNKS